MKCPICGEEMDMTDEPFTGGELYRCEKCCVEGFGIHDADDTYKLELIISEEWEGCEEEHGAEEN